jgi:hypothetical protein
VPSEPAEEGTLMCQTKRLSATAQTGRAMFLFVNVCGDDNNGLGRQKQGQIRVRLEAALAVGASILYIACSIN